MSGSSGPWKAVSAATGSLSVILLGALLFGGKGAPDPEADGAEVARLKTEINRRERELTELRGQISSFGEAAFLAGRVKSLEAERDSLRRQLDAALKDGDQLRGRVATLEGAAAAAPPTPKKAGAPPPEPPAPRPEKLAQSIADLVDRCAPAVVFVQAGDRGGAGFFITKDGFAITNYHVIAGSEKIELSYLLGGVGGSAKKRIKVAAKAYAIDGRNDLALLKAETRDPVASLELDPGTALRTGDEVIAIGNPAMGAVILEHSVSNGIISSLSRKIGDASFLQTTAAINSGNSGGPLLNKDGLVVGVVTAKAREAQNIGFAIPAAAIRALLDARDGAFRVQGTLAQWEQKNAGTLGSGDATSSIEVPGYILDMILDEENDRILALDGDSSHIMVVSISQRKVLKQIPTGAGAFNLHTVPSTPNMVWVSNRDSQTFVKIDVGRGKTVDTIAVNFTPGEFVLTDTHIWAYGSTPTIQLVPLQEKKHWDTYAPLLTLSYDRRFDTVIGANASTILYEFDASKMVVTVMDLARLKPDSPESEINRMIARLKALVKVHRVPAEALQGITHGLSIVIEPKRNLLFFNRAILKLDDLSKTVGILKSNPYSTSGDAKIRGVLERLKFLDLIVAASRNGKWVANGTHIFSVETFTAVKEIPVPTSCAFFSKDSKRLYYYDAVHRSIAWVEVE